jgi:SAM-dependent methyltransferase
MPPAPARRAATGSGQKDVERGEYERLSAAEERRWWFRGLHANLIAAWRSAATPPPRPVVLDAGCGTGGFLKRLARARPDAVVLGLDVAPRACAMAQAKSGRPVCAGSVDALPFADASLDAVFSADVLCHRGVAEGAALVGFHRCLKPGGVAVLNLPAYRWLFSAHDLAVDNVRRYGRRDVRRLLAAAGFTRIRIAHWNTLLFPLMAARRKLPLPSRRAPASDVAPLPAPVERAFRAAVALEGGWLRLGLPLPFGGSILVTAVKP